MGAAGAGALGLAPHSGWAASVVLGGTRSAPAVLARERLELTDEHLAGARAPYHAMEPLPLARAAEARRRYEASARALAERSLRALFAHTAPVRAAGILDSSGR